MDYKKKLKDIISSVKTPFADIDIFLKYFPELKKSEGERIRKGIINCLEGNMPDNEYRKKYIAWLENQGKKDEEISILKDQIESLHAAMKALKEIHKIELEKQNKQKSQDKSTLETTNKPKFKVGDWVFSELNNVLQIKFIGDNYYVLENTIRVAIDYADKCWHLWSIKDARDGDILVSSSGKPFIFNGEFNDFCVGGYCGININNSFKTDISRCNWTYNKDIKPANKKQCNKLFKAIIDAGYKWDTKKRELNKLNK